MAFPTPGSKPEFDRPAPEPFGLARLIRFPGGFRDPQARRLKTCGSFFDRRNPAVNRNSILFLVLASFVLAMLSSAGIANFVMRSNNPIDVCPNEHVGNLRGGYWSRPRRNGARELQCRPQRDRVFDGNMFCSGRSKPSARESFECLRMGAEPCAPGLPIPAQHRPARAPLLPPECHRIFGRSRSVRKSIRA